MEITFLNEQFELDYEGDHPWYCAAFVDPPGPKAVEQIEELSLNYDFVFAYWVDESRYTIEAELDRLELQKWVTDFQPKIRELISAIHNISPISKVGFIEDEF